VFDYGIVHEITPLLNNNIYYCSGFRLSAVSGVKYRLMFSLLADGGVNPNLLGERETKFHRPPPHNEGPTAEVRGLEAGRAESGGLGEGAEIWCNMRPQKSLQICLIMCKGLQKG